MKLNWTAWGHKGCKPYAWAAELQEIEGDLFPTSWILNGEDQRGKQRTRRAVVFEDCGGGTYCVEIPYGNCIKRELPSFSAGKEFAEKFVEENWNKEFLETWLETKGGLKYDQSNN